MLVATAAWGVDNTLSHALAERDPGQVVMAKAVFGATATTAMTLGLGEPLSPLQAALGLFAIGASGYGLSLRFYLLAQRAFGAARTGSVFAFAPFIGAVFAVALGDRSASGLMAMRTLTKPWSMSTRIGTTTAITTMFTTRCLSATTVTGIYTGRCGMCMLMCPMLITRTNTEDRLGRSVTSIAAGFLQAHRSSGSAASTCATP